MFDGVKGLIDIGQYTNAHLVKVLEGIRTLGKGTHGKGALTNLDIV